MNIILHYLKIYLIPELLAISITINIVLFFYMRDKIKQSELELKHRELVNLFWHLQPPTAKN